MGRAGLSAHGPLGEDGVLESDLAGVRVLRWAWPEPLLPGRLPLVAWRHVVLARALSYPDNEHADLVGRRLELERRRRDARPSSGPPQRVEEALAGARETVHRRRTQGLDAGRRGRAAASRQVVELSAEAGVELGWGTRLDPLLAGTDVVWVVGDAVLPAAVGALRRVPGLRPRLVYDVLTDLSALERGVGLRPRLAGGGQRARTERHLAPWADVLVVATPEGRRAARTRFAPATPVVEVPDLLPEQPAAGPDGSGGREPAAALAELPEGSLPLVVLDPHRAGAVRSLREVVVALPHLPGARLVVIANQGAPGMRDLRELARRTGVEDRFHWHDESADAWLRTSLAGAALGLLPAGDPDEDAVRLPGAYHRFVRDGVPVLAQRAAPAIRVLAAEGSGAVVDLGRAGAVRDVLVQALRHRSRLAARLGRRPSGTGQVAALHRLLDDLAPVAAPVPDAPPQTAPPRGTAAGPPVERRVTPVPLVLGVGPANFAGQGWAWAKAAERAVPGLRTEVFAVHQGALTFRSDRVVTRSVSRTLEWQLAEQRHVLSTYTHLLAEANRSLFGSLLGDDARADVAMVRRHGIVVGLAMHGSEVRDPERHAASEEFSPFRATSPQATDYRRRATELVAQTKRLLEEFDGPVFVSTPDLLLDVPDGIWLPVVVDLDRPQGEPPLSLDRPPLVVHAPSRAYAKGTDLVEPVVQALAEEGLLEYRRLRGVAPDRMPQLIASADVVLDQFALGSYGALACEAMVAGRVVVGHVSDQVRERVGQDLPIVQATPRDLEAVLRGLVADPAAARAVAARGREFVADVHSGERSGAALRDHLLSG